MENPQRPNHSDKENCNKRKRASEENSNEFSAENCNKRKTPPEKKDDNVLDLNLRLGSIYHDVKRAKSIDSPREQQQQQQEILLPIVPPLSPNHLSQSIQPLLVPPYIPTHAQALFDQSIPFNSSPRVASPVVAFPPSPPPHPSNDGLDNNEIIIRPPFPWATDRPAKIHTLKHLLDNKIDTITGEVQCGSCNRIFEMELNLMQKFNEFVSFYNVQKRNMHDRAPREWNHPVLLNCEHCGHEKSVKPVIGDQKEHSINWLFLMLGQFLGLCTLEQLRYFGTHTMDHRSGAKDRVLYLTYTQLLKQLLPDGRI